MIVVAGSYNQDLVWRTPRFPKAGETRSGLFSQGPGGKGFNQAMADMSAATFIDEILVQGLNTGWLLVGEDFRYGHKRAGASAPSTISRILLSEYRRAAA